MSNEHSSADVTTGAASTVFGLFAPAAASAALGILSPAIPTVSILYALLREQNKKGAKGEKSASTSEESDDISKKDLLKLLDKHSRLIHDLAISRRIDTAEKVSIEEFYDTRAEGKAGAKATPESGVDFSVGGGGQRVVRRVYTFEGWRDGGLDTITKLFPELDEKIAAEAASSNSDEPTTDVENCPVDD